MSSLLPSPALLWGAQSRGRTLFLNGRILTGEQLLSASPRVVSALLVEDGWVTAAGDRETVEWCAGASGAGMAPKRVDLGGAFAMPGFNDAHLHLGEGTRLRREVDLAGARSLEEALARIEQAAAHGAPGAWITGGGWDETLWPGGALPSRYDLDRVTGSRPAVFARADVHVSVANSAALALGGVTHETFAPRGSAIDRDEHDEATGILRERRARDLVERHIPVASLEERKRGLRPVLAEALSLGVTSVQDNSTDEDFAALRDLHADGELSVRVSEWLPFDAPLGELERRRAAINTGAPGNRFLRTTMLKAFLDGSLGSRTAAMLTPYADAPKSAGIALYTQGELTERALERAAAGFQLGFHAIGDRALAMALTTFAAVREARVGAGPGVESRFRIEHAQTAGEDAFARARGVGAVASMQPGHLLTDARWAIERLGPERAARAYAWRSFLAAGVPLAFGTDYPVEPLTPFRGLYAAVTRLGESGGEPFYGEQRLRMAEALHACTQGAAYAEGSEEWKGMLRPGFVADFVVLDRDLLDCVPRSVLETRVLRTVVDGRTVYEGEAR